MNTELANINNKLNISVRGCITGMRGAWRMAHAACRGESGCGDMGGGEMLARAQVR